MKNIPNKLAKIALYLSTALALTSCGHQASFMPQPVFQAAPLQIQNQSTEIIVKFHPYASRHAMQQFNQKFGLQLVNIIGPINAHVFKIVQKNMPMTQMLHAMQQDPIVEYAEENHKISVTPIAEMGIQPILK